MLAMWEYFWDSAAWVQADNTPAPPGQDQSGNPLKPQHGLSGLQKI